MKSAARSPARVMTNVKVLMKLRFASPPLLPNVPLDAMVENLLNGVPTFVVTAPAAAGIINIAATAAPSNFGKLIMPLTLTNAKGEK
ncbi:MAG: hypothetical protein EON55_25970 [Alphaproteobacteria bacterium]|nr:MAG: hypothetical protein EON55_25970 [Alphaproteobacteria bacterium]